MATIKSYTDINQSKKLAKILPLGSADMIWVNDNDVIVVPYDKVTRENIVYDFIPCWSLAALLSVLSRVDIEKEIYSNNTYIYRVKAYIGDGYVGEWYDNPIDACVVMVKKLHELKML